jgi:hypothetical protein
MLCLYNNYRVAWATVKMRYLDKYSHLVHILNFRKQEVREYLKETDA